MTTIIWIPLENLISSFSDTIRPDDIDVALLLASLRAHGYDSGEPIIVQFGEYRIVDHGHIRVAALRWLAENDPIAFQRILPDGRVPCRLVKPRTSGHHSGE